MPRPNGGVCRGSFPGHYYLFGLVYMISERVDFSRTGLRVNGTERAGAARLGWARWTDGVGYGRTRIVMGWCRSGAGRREPKPHGSQS